MVLHSPHSLKASSFSLRCRFASFEFCLYWKFHEGNVASSIAGLVLTILAFNSPSTTDVLECNISIITESNCWRVPICRCPHWDCSRRYASEIRDWDSAKFWQDMFLLERHYHLVWSKLLQMWIMRIKEDFPVRPEALLASRICMIQVWYFIQIWIDGANCG